MILSDREVLELVEKGELIIKPFRKECLDDVSYEIHLADEFVVMDYINMPVIDVAKLSEIKYMRINSKKIVVQPHEFVLARTIEWIELPSNITCFVSGKSSLARLGLQVHAAALIHPGSRGYIVLEIFNHNNVPIVLREKMAIAHIVFMRNAIPKRDYSARKGNYLGQKTIILPTRIGFLD